MNDSIQLLTEVIGMTWVFEKDDGIWSVSHQPNAYVNPKAPVYLISGSAGCHTPDAWFTDQPWPWSAVRNNDYGWSVVTVANTTHIRVEQISIDKNEQTVDDFWVIKDAGYTHSSALRRANPGKKFPKQKCHVKDVACQRSLKEINEELWIRLQLLETFDHLCYFFASSEKSLRRFFDFFLEEGVLKILCASRQTLMIVNCYRSSVRVKNST